MSDTTPETKPEKRPAPPDLTHRCPDCGLCGKATISEALYYVVDQPDDVLERYTAEVQIEELQHVAEWLESQGEHALVASVRQRQGSIRSAVLNEAAEAAAPVAGGSA